MLRLFIALGLLAIALPSPATLWTNQAGQVIEATLRDFDGVSVTVVRTNNTTIKLPLRSLCMSDQQRVLAAHGQSIAPEFLKAAFRDASVPLERFDRLPLSQQTSEARVQAAHMACLVFDARVSAHAAALTNQLVAAEVKRLRGVLATGVSGRR
jgi:hypothetical protein